MTNVTFEKDKFAGYMQLAQLGLDQWDRRRVYEWRVTFALWAALAGALWVKEITVPLYVGPILFVGHFLWLRRTWLANDNNKAFARFYLSKSQALLGDTDCPPTLVTTASSRNLRGFLEDTGFLYPLIGTALLVCSLYAIKGW